MAYRVSVDHALCSSIGSCLRHAPEVFALDRDNELQLLQDEPSDELRDRVEAAAMDCPMQAITVRES